MIMPVNMLSALSRCSINETYAATTYLKCATHIFLGSERNYHTATEKEEELKCYKTLELPIGCDQEQLRSTFLQLVKRYHPDSGSNEADADRFQQIEAAYRKLQDKFASERGKQNEGEGEYGLYYQEKEDESCIKHTAPQHRQYLSYDGFGAGTPQQREKQYQVYRAAVAQENVYRHKVDKITSQLGAADALIFKDKKEAKKHKTSLDSVEKQIYETSKQEELKPKSDIDYWSQRMTQFIFHNDLVPDWVILQQEINEERSRIHKRLMAARKQFGEYPLIEEDRVMWTDIANKYKAAVDSLNMKIEEYNSQAPLVKERMALLRLEDEAQKCLQAEGITTGKPIAIYPEPLQREDEAEEPPAKASTYRIKKGKASEEVRSRGWLSAIESLFTKTPQ